MAKQFPEIETRHAEFIARQRHVEGRREAGAHGERARKDECAKGAIVAQQGEAGHGLHDAVRGECMLGLWHVEERIEAEGRLLCARVQVQ